SSKKTRKFQEGVCLWKQLLPQLWCHVIALVDMTGVIRQRKDLIMHSWLTHLQVLTQSFTSLHMNFLPPTSDLSFTGLDEFVNKPVVKNRKSNKEVSKVVRKSDDSPIIEDWVSNSEEENVSQTKTKKKTIKPNIAKIEFGKPKQQEKTARKTVKQVPQHSGLIKHVADEAIHKELGDSLVRAATTASRLEAEQDSARVESSGDEEDLVEDASKQGRRINAIDADEDITLGNDDVDKEMFDVDALNGEEVFVAGQNENAVEEIVDAAQVSTAATTVTITTKEVTLAQALANLKITKPKAKGIAFREPGESTTTIFSQQLQEKGLSQDKEKGTLVEPEKPLKKKDQLKLDEEIALKLQAKIDEDERITRAEEEKNDEANIS
ncbi:hypothetical protein Tco_1322614, partial [Tanacetum coccineum]